MSKQIKYLTGLRGIAALMVFVTHVFSYTGFLEGKSYIFQNFIQFGKYGVVIFFVLSAFLISLSIGSSSNFKLTDYLKKRTYRVIPLYYIIVTIGYFLGGIPYYLEYFQIKNDFKSLFMHLSFLNLVDSRYRNNILAVEWTIPLEMVFYLVIPVVFYLIKIKKERILLFIMLGFIFTFTSYNISLLILKEPNISISSHWDILLYSFPYAIGIGLSFLTKFIDKFRFKSIFLVFILLCLIIYIIDGTLLGNDMLTIIFMSIITALIILVSSSDNKLTQYIFENRFILFIGNISYSFYLIHFLVIHFVSLRFSFLPTLLLSFIVTILISTCSYYLIELPFMKLAKLDLRFKLKENNM